MINIIGNAIGSKISGGAAVNEAFEFTVQTDNAGTSAANQFTIPITSATPYDIQTSDGQTITGATGATTLTFPSAGTYTIKITESCNGWSFNNGGDKLKLLNISNWGVFAMTLGGAFFGASNMTCSATDAPINQPTTMYRAFYNCTNFNGAIGNWDVSAVTSFTQFLAYTQFNQPLANWSIKTTGTVSMSYMFWLSPFNQDISGWDTSAVTDMSFMFDSNTAFNQDISGWNVSSVTNFTNMFKGASAFDYPLNSWDVSSATNMYGMFGTSTYNHPLDSWNVSNVTNMALMFNRNPAFNQDLNSWDVSNVTNMNQMFSNLYGSLGQFNGNITSWDTSSVTNMKNMFNTQGVFNQDISGWDVSSVTTFEQMFENAREFNQPIGAWNLSGINSVNSLAVMFRNAWLFDQDLSNWSQYLTAAPSVTSLNSMFAAARAFNNGDQPINWDVSNIIDFASLFSGTHSFNQDLGSWDMSSATSISQMFRGAQAFNNGGSPSINNWDTSNVTNMNGVFYAPSVFNQPIGNWDTSSVTDMGGMFYSNLVFDQPIGAWDTSNVTNMSNMFYITIIDQNLSNWNIGSIPPNTGNFNWNKRANYGIPFSTANYDAMLVAYEAQVPPVGLVWNIGDATYSLGSAAETARTSLINTYGWTITDGGGIVNPFTITVDTTLGDGLPQFTIPTTGTGYNYDVATSDGQSITGNTGNTTITFPSTGTYTVEITGDFPRIYFNNGGDRLKLTDVNKWGSIAWTSFDRAFYNCNNMTITATDIPNVSAVTSFYFGFRGTAISGSIDLSSWDLSSVAQIGYMFANCTGITSVNLNSLSTNAIASDGVFLGANSTTTVTLPVGFRPTVFRNMFSNANSLTDIVNVETWNLSSAVRGDYWLQNTTVQPNISGWTIPPTFTILKGIFAYCQINVDVSGWDVSNVQDFSELCAVNSAFNQDISGWNMASAINLDAAFTSATSFNQPIGSWNVSNVTSMNQLFQSANAFDQDLSTWNTSNVTTMRQMFLTYVANQGNTTLNSIGSWDVSNVTDMYRMFESVNWGNPDITNWNTQNVQNFGRFMQSSTNFNRNLSGWNTSSATNMSNMFYIASSFNNGGDPGINNWNTSSVTDMQYMFQSASAFNQPIGNWDVSNVTNMKQMFNITSFNQDISSWDMSSVTTIEAMLGNNAAFNQPIGNWDTSNISNFGFALYNADAFDQSLANWNILSMTTAGQFMRLSTGLSVSNYDATLVSWEAQLQTAFPGGAGYTPVISIDFGGSQYTLGSVAETARTSLINTYGWTITDGGGVLTNESYLVASYNFDSNFTDYTGNHPLTATGSVTAGTAGGKVSNCSDFNGTTSDYLLGADSDDFSFTNGSNDLPFSVSMWVNFDAVSNAWFMDKRTSGNDEWQITYYLGKLNMALFSAGATSVYLYGTYTVSLSASTWYHIAFTYDGSGTFAGINFYLDGVNQTLTDESVGTYAGMTNGTAPLRLGTFTSGFSFNGKMDEAHIWKNRELTAAQVTDIYNTENAGNSILPAPASPPLLDTYTGAVAAYSLRDLSSSTTNVVRVRRSSDNTEQDFTSTQVTDGTLETFVGAGNDGFVVTWYDQSGQNHDLTFISTEQPQIVTSGVLNLDNGTPYMLSTGNYHGFTTLSPVPSSTSGTFFCTYNTNDTGNGCMFARSSSVYTGILESSSSQAPHAAIGAPLYYKNGTLIPSATRNDMFTNFKTNQDELCSITNLDISNQALSGVYPYTYSAASYTQIVKMKEWIFFDADQSANQLAIETNINNYYTIY